MGRLLSTEERARAEERRWADGLEGETESQTDEMMDRASGSEMNWKEEGGGGREGGEGRCEGRWNAELAHRMQCAACQQSCCSLVTLCQWQLISLLGSADDAQGRTQQADE